MVKINDQVLAEVGLQLANEKMLPVATLADQLSVTLDGESYRRRGVVASDGALPSGSGSGSVIAFYTSPADAAIRWYGGSLRNAGLALIANLSSTHQSAKGSGDVTWCDLVVDDQSTRLILGGQTSRYVRQIDFAVSTILVPAGQKLKLDLAPLSGNLSAASITWTIVGFTEPLPRTGGNNDVIAPTDDVIVP